jgi:hypothetical protein
MLRPILDFINVLEDDASRLRLSLTKLGLWGSTLANLTAYLGGADWKAQAGLAGMNLAAMIKHEIKRSTAK